LPDFPSQRTDRRKDAIRETAWLDRTRDKTIGIGRHGLGRAPGRSAPQAAIRPLPAGFGPFIVLKAVMAEDHDAWHRDQGLAARDAPLSPQALPRAKGGVTVSARTAGPLLS